jgi:hypothetical protein
MVDPRIYRTALSVVALALIVFGFSFEGQPSAATTNVAPIPLAAGNSQTSLPVLSKEYPGRAPGSYYDGALAEHVAAELRSDQFVVSSSSFTAQTANGSRTLKTVIGTRTGIAPGTIVVVSDRDDVAGLSGTAAMLDVARVLSGEPQHRSVMLVSTSGSVGAAGASQLAGALAGQPVDAVIVLGDLSGIHATEPVVVPWSDGQALAPPLLRATLAAYVSADAGLRAGNPGLGAQLAHLALPLSTTEQGPFGARGIPAVLLSTAGERAGTPGAQSGVRLTALYGALLQTINALNTGPAVPAATPYLLINGDVVPFWAIRLLVLALILPVLAATIDALARARRRGHSIGRWLVWVLASAVPFIAVLVLIAIARLTGWLAATPAGPVGAGGVPLGSSGDVLLVAIGVVLVSSFVLLRPLCIRLAARLGALQARRQPQSPAADGAAVALALVMCATALVIWVLQPVAAALLVPALHLWLWLTDSRIRSRRVLLVAFAVVGLAPPVLVVAYYVHALGLSASGVLWNGVLLIAGGQLGPLAAVYWSIMLGCVASLLVLIARSSGEPVAVEPEITVRGPVNYAGPGSLGGTNSALRVRR